MRITRLALVALLPAAACARPQQYTAVAPASSLECALREAQQIGYARMAGEPAERAIRVAQRIEPPPAQQRDPRDPMLGEDRVRPTQEDPPTENQLLLRHDGRRLRVQIVSAVERSLRVQPTSGADDHAQMIIARCAGG